MAENDAPNPDLLALRVQIDALDRELLAALNRRAQLAQTVGEVKKREGSVAFRPEREAQVINGLQAANPGPLKKSNVGDERMRPPESRLPGEAEHPALDDGRHR